MYPVHRRATGATMAAWAAAVAWPVAGSVVPALSPRRLPELHNAVLVLAGSLTISVLAPRLMASHARMFAHGVAVAGMEPELPPRLPGSDNKVITFPRPPTRLQRRMK